MPISASDIEWRLSGGSANTNPSNSLGGAMSTVAGGKMTSDVMNNLWSNVSGPDATSGKTNYRCAYIKNANGTLTFLGVKMWISQLTASSSDEVDIGLDNAAPGSDSTTTSNGETDPGVTFRRPVSETDPLVWTIGDMAPGQQKAFWVKRTVQAGAAAFATNSYELSISGETT